MWTFGAGKKYKFEEVLSAITDTGNTRQRAAKLAGTLYRIIDEDFGIDELRSTLISNDYEQRRIFALFAFSLIYPIPAELSSIESWEIFLQGYTNRKVSHNFIRRTYLG